MKGEFEKRIDEISEVSMIEDGFEITAQVKEIIEQARKEFPRVKAGITFYVNKEGREVIDGNLHPEYYRKLAMEWVEKWFGDKNK